MQPSRFVFRLSWLIILLAVVAAGVGLLASGGDGPADFVAVRGDTVQLYGQGWYRLDTLVSATSFRAGDLATLAPAIPLLAFASAPPTMPIAPLLAAGLVRLGCPKSWLSSLQRQTLTRGADPANMRTPACIVVATVARLS